VPAPADAAKVALLGHIDLFAGCSNRDLGRIARVAEEHEIQEGDVLTEQGQARDDVFVIIEGVARVLRNGREVARVTDGDVVGELAVLDPGPRTATVIAASPMLVLVLRADQMEQVIRENPEVALALLRALARKLRATSPSL
jgi:CRP-like cAMP-binding protein